MDSYDRWFVNRQVIAEMSGTNNQLAVKPLFESASDLFPGMASVAMAIDHHNRQMGLNNAQHNKGKDKAQLRSIAATSIQLRFEK